MSGVVHFEIPADNEDRARKFYESVFGWTFQVLPEMEYSLAMTTPVNNRGGFRAPAGMPISGTAKAT